jgi:hypothetical protein
MRTFETGATRDKDDGKLDFEGFFSPLVVERFAQYMHKHRVQADGSVRASDNWQNLFGDDHYAVCMKSAWRHFFSWWAAHRGLATHEDIEDSVMALLFNAMAYMHKRLSEKAKTGDD